MFLTASNVFHYLRDAGLVGGEDVVEESFAVVERGRRNRNFKILRPGGASLFVKQVPVVHAETVGSFLREAACAQVAVAAPAGSAVSGMTPTLRRYDPARHILVYDAIDPAATLAEETAKTLVPSPGHAAALGRLLAGIHAETARPGALAAIAAALPGQPPWVFAMAQDAERVMPNLSPAGRQVVDRLRAAPELRGGLAAAGAQWRRDCLIHGDVKWDNVLASADGPAAAVRLIDWELADIGDPSWDVAGALVGWLQFWLLNLRPDVLQASPALAVGQAAVPLAAAHAPAQAFWRAYAGVGSGAGTLDHVGRLCAARLCALAFELVPTGPQITPHAAFALELARYLFADPPRAMADLLGLGPFMGAGE